MIIGVSGYAQTGKSTTAEILVRDFGYVESSFAAPLKEALLRLDPYINHTFRLREYVEAYGWEHAKKIPETRALLQRFGTEVGREMWGQNFWVDLGVRGLKTEDRVVFSDVRFISEASSIKALGGKIIRVNRKGYEPVNMHKSETELDGWHFDCVLSNNGTLEDLAEEVNHAMQALQ